MQLIVIRHAQTIANKYRIVQSLNHDTAISIGGTDYIEKIVTSLKSLSIDKVISSDLQRAYDTAQKIITCLKMDLNIETSPLLREIDFGLYSNLPVESLRGSIIYHKRFTNTKYPKGESGADMQNRILNFFDRLRGMEYSNHFVLIVTHFGPLESIKNILKLDKFDPYKINLLTFEGGYLSESECINPGDSFSRF